VKREGSVRQNFSSGGKREPVIGYSRSVRVGQQVFVSGCVAYGTDGQLVGPGDMYAQTRQVIANVERGLQLAGAELRHVVRTRIYVTDVSRWEEAARAHGEAFGKVLPACTFLGVAGLVNPEMLVEIDADAIVED
jgi:enamine deaminase RidA (YjgF/YER057c/UK114 family)